MPNPTHNKPLDGGREAFYDSRTSTFIVRNPKDPDGGTAFHSKTVDESCHLQISLNS